MQLKDDDSTSPRTNFTAGIGNNNQQVECLLSSTNGNVEERCIPIAGGRLNLTVYGMTNNYKVLCGYLDVLYNIQNQRRFLLIVTPLAWHLLESFMSLYVAQASVGQLSCAAM